MERRAILDTVKQKIDADYRSRLGQWEEEFYQDDVGFLEHLHDVCVAQIVHDNLMKCGDRYDAGYLAALAEEKDPLDMLAKAYEDGGFFAIAPCAQQALDALKKSPDSGSGSSTTPISTRKASTPQKIWRCLLPPTGLSGTPWTGW